MESIAHLGRRVASLTRAEIDAEIFATLYEYYLPRVFSYMVCRTGNQALAEDLTAAVFEKAWQKMATYRGDRGAFSTWLFTIARRIVADHFRRHKSPDTVSLEELPQPIVAEGTPESECLRREELLWFHTCLKTLSEREQEIVALRFFSGLANKEIARILGLKEGHVGVILYRAIRKLRKEYENEKGITCAP